MKRIFKRKEKGQGLVEYGLILALVAIVAVFGITQVGSQVTGVFNSANATLDGAGSPAGTPQVLLPAAPGSPIASGSVIPYSWAEIAVISKAGQAAMYFAIGAEKDVTVGGETLTMQIYGLNHDDKADGTGKAGITFGTKHLMAATQQINLTNTNVGGWDGCSLRTKLNGSLVYDQLPADVKNAIEPVTKLTANKGISGSIIPSTDKVFAFSEIEFFGVNNCTYAGEGIQYPIFSNNASRIKKLNNGYGAVNYYHGRSPNLGDSGAFTLIALDGSYYGYTTVSPIGVAFGFSI